MERNTSHPRVVEFFRDSTPVLDFRSEVEKALASLPVEYLSRLDSIVLRNRSELQSKERRTKLQAGVPVTRATGFYASAKPPGGASITLFVDTIIDRWPNWFARVPVLPYEAVNRVLFHELGHHLQALEARRNQSEQEAVRIGERLHRRSFRKRRPLLVPVAWILRLIVRSLLFVSDLYRVPKTPTDRQDPS